MATKWYEMGLQLNVDQKELDTINHDHHDDSKVACRTMFTEWLENTPTEKSWNKVLEALQSQSVGKSSLASSLVKQLSN